MRTCARCNNIVNDNETFCNRCGCNRFNVIKPMQVPQQNKMENLGNVTESTVKEIPRKYIEEAPKPTPSEKIQTRSNTLGGLQNSIPNKQLEQIRIQDENDEDDEDEELIIPERRAGIGGIIDTIKQEHSDSSSILDWLKTLLILCIPVYNIVFMIKAIEKREMADYKITMFYAMLMIMATSLVFVLLITIISLLISL